MLKANKLRKEYGSTVAVDDVSLEIETGEFATIVGPSGCGKTTLLRMIAGHLEPTGGTIELNGKDITTTPPERRPTSLVFQSWALFPHMTVRENIEFPMRNNGMEVGDRVEELLEQVRLDPAVHADKQVTDLSGGQKQRVALARSLAYDPDILLLDEPLASLDYVLQKRLQRELADLNEELGMTFIYVTHSLESALVMSDTLFVLNHGRIIQTGAPEEIYRRPNNRFIAEFMGDANVFDLEAASRKNGSYEVESPQFVRAASAPYHHDDGEPKYLVVRYDDTVVDSTLTEDLGVEIDVENVLVKGNTVLVECAAPDDDAEYVAEMPIDEYKRSGVEKHDRAYLQWTSSKSILVPE